MIEFGISRPHTQLSVELRARVTTATAGGAARPGVDGPRALELSQHRASSTCCRGPRTRRTCASTRSSGLTRAESPLETLRKLVEIIPDRFEYRRGVTFVGSTVDDLLESGAGVCQDFAHLALLALRRNGIAARYVSGYLFAPSGGDEAADSAEVDTHAWVEALLPAEEEGGESRWVGIDPTNRVLVGENYVKIGHGRGYADVPPIKGVYRGGGTTDLRVQVKMQRLNGSHLRVARPPWPEGEAREGPQAAPHDDDLAGRGHRRRTVRRLGRGDELDRPRGDPLLPRRRPAGRDGDADAGGDGGRQPDRRARSWSTPARPWATAAASPSAGCTGTSGRSSSPIEAVAGAEILQNWLPGVPDLAHEPDPHVAADRDQHDVGQELRRVRVLVRLDQGRGDPRLHRDRRRLPDRRRRRRLAGPVEPHHGGRLLPRGRHQRPRAAS